MVSIKKTRANRNHCGIKKQIRHHRRKIKITRVTNHDTTQKSCHKSLGVFPQLNAQTARLCEELFT